MEIVKLIIDGKEVEEEILEESEFERNEELSNLEDTLVLNPIKEENNNHE